MTVQIPVKTTYDPTGVKAAERDLKRLQQEQIRATRQQIAEHRRVQQLTAKLDRDMAGRGRVNFGQQIAQQTVAGMGALSVMQDMARFTTDYTTAAVSAAAASERLERATDNLGARFGVAGDAIKEAIQSASGNTINKMDAMRAANQAMLLGVAKNEEEFRKLTEIAVVLGRAMGQDATKSIEDMTIGVGRQSKLILDNLGIMVNTERAYEKYAATIGKTAAELTDAEKKQAFINETLAQGQAKMESLGGITLDTAGKVERLNSRLADFQAAFGGAILAVTDGSGVLNTIDPILSGATDALEEFSDKSRAINKLRDDAYKGREGLKALEDGADTAMAVINPFGLAVEKVTNYFANQAINADALAKAQEDLAATAQDAGNAAEDQADAEEESADAMKEAAKAAEELARRLERANEARRDVARELLDITEQAAADTAETWDDYFKDEANAWKDHSKTVEKINADSEKERVQIQKDLAKSLLDIDKDLAKDLAKVDKDLAKDKAKFQRDSEKQIARMVQDAAKQEKRERRQRQIDAKGDQRLFDFEMRQLAAEGEFNQILAAKERRAIEQQIAAEKSSEEDRQRQEDSRLEIQQARQDARDRLAEMEAEAEERKQMLLEQAEEQRAAAMEQAVEEEARRQEELAQALAEEQANYQERLEALRQARDEKLAAIEEGKQESIAKLAEELTETKDLTRKEMEALIPVAAGLGEDVGTAFAEGLSGGFAKNQQINQMLTPGSVTPKNTPKINPAHPSVPSNFAPKPKPTKSIYGFADGGAFTVGGAGGTDSQLVQFLATPGERVTVTPPGGGGMTFNINAGSEDLARRLMAAIRPVAERVVNEYHDEIIVPWSNGA